LILVAGVAALRFLVPPGRIPGARETWVTVLALWLLGVVWSAVIDRSATVVGDRVGDIGAQNLGIQALIVVPSVVLGVARLMSADGGVSAAFPTNALVTVVFLPLASLVILTLAALPVLWALLKIRGAVAPGMPTVLLLGAVGLLAACGGAVSSTAALDPATVAAGREIYSSNGCANCHGDDGSGRGTIGAGFDPPPRDYRDPAAYRVGADIDTIAQTIADGLPAPGGGMPAFRHFDLERRTQLATYIASLQRPDSTIVTVRDPWVGEAIPGTDATGAWFTIVNGGGVDTVVGVEARGARRAMLHAMRNSDSMMTMERMEELVLPAGEEVALEPGGNHLMLERLDAPMAAGDSVDITLFLSSGTAVRFTAPVRARDGAR
jgi:hypothetical protein